MLATAGLDDIRLARDLGRLLKAKKTEFYKGQVAANCVDNGTRMRAVELLAELLGRKKAELNINTDLPEIVMRIPDDPGVDDTHDGK